MRPLRTHPRRYIVLTTLLAFLTGAALPPALSAADHAFTLYRSEQLGYFFFHDASTWKIVEQTSGPEDEYVRFSDGEVWAGSWAVDAPGVMATECLDAILFSSRLRSLTLPTMCRSDVL